MIFLFARWDMLVSWRVHQIMVWNGLEKVIPFKYGHGTSIDVKFLGCKITVNQKNLAFHGIVRMSRRKRGLWFAGPFIRLYFNRCRLEQLIFLNVIYFKNLEGFRRVLSQFPIKHYISPCNVSHASLMVSV